MFFKSPEDKLLGIKKKKINGVLFTIKRISVSDHIQGYNVLVNVYDSWNNKRKNDKIEHDVKKVKEFYTDIFLKGVVRPALSKKDEEGKINVEEIFNDWEMAHKLFHAIMENTLKKKL